TARPPRRATLAPYTTPFRSAEALRNSEPREAYAWEKSIYGGIAQVVGYAFTSQVNKVLGGITAFLSGGLAPLIEEHDQNVRRERSEEHTSGLQSREKLVCRL